MAPTLKLGVIGGNGWLARTIIKALLAKQVVTERDLGIAYRSTAPTDLPSVFATTDPQALVDSCDTIVLSVRPADFGALRINASGKRVISVMAGLSMTQLAARTRARCILRAMPNVAASIGYSYTPIVASPEATSTDVEIAREIFGACGLCDLVESEEHLDYLTGLTGSGPAYPALLASALKADALARGIAPDIAERAVFQLLVGSGHLLEKDPKPMADIVREFVEYKGVIAAAITDMKANGFEGAVSKGLDAALNKVRSLGLSPDLGETTPGR